MAKNKAAISAHPLFPAIVALWFAALLGLGSLVLPPALFDRAVSLTRLDTLLPMAAPPIGIAGRLLIALAAAVIGAALGVSLTRRIVAANRPVRTASSRVKMRGEQTRGEEEAARKPISVKDELGEALDAPAGQSEKTRQPSPIPGRRRALAMHEEEGPSDFLQVAPLPGGELDFGKVAAAVTATISMTSLPRHERQAPTQDAAAGEALDLQPFASDLADLPHASAPEASTEEEPIEAAPFSAPDSPNGSGVRNERAPAFAAPEIAAEIAPPVTPQECETEAGLHNQAAIETQPAAAPLIADPVAQAQLGDLTEADEPAVAPRFAAPAASEPACAVADPVPAAIGEEPPQTELDEPPLAFSPPSLSRSLPTAIQEDHAAAGPDIGEAAQPEVIALALDGDDIQSKSEPEHVAGEPEAPLAELGITDLAERLGRSLHKKLQQAPPSAAHGVPHANSGEDALSVKLEPTLAAPQPDFSAAPEVPTKEAERPASSVPLAIEPERDDEEQDGRGFAGEAAKEALPFAAPKAPPAPVIPAALRPIELILEEDLDAEEEAMSFGLPLQKPTPAGEALAEAAGDENNGSDEVAENEGYSSLLEMRNPFRPTEEFVRIDEPETETADYEAAVTFPGSKLETGQTGDAAKSSADSGRSFAAPTPGTIANLPPRPKTGADRAQAEQALRAALATLQRISGAA